MSMNDYDNEMRSIDLENSRQEGYDEGYKTAMRKMLEYFSERDNAGQYVGYMHHSTYRKYVKLSKEK